MDRLPQIRDLSREDSSPPPRRYAPPEHRLDKVLSDDVYDNGAPPPYHDEPPELIVDLDKLESDMAPTAPKEPLVELADFLGKLTYLEMMSLAQGVCKDDERAHDVADRIAAWSRKMCEVPESPQEAEMAAGEEPAAEVGVV